MKVAISGLGLIGGSFYKASLAAGYDAIGLHHGECEGLDQAELVLVCQPPEAIAAWVEEHVSRFRPGAVVVDVCGVKRSVMRDVGALLGKLSAAGERPNFTFVGGHPMAGREVSGYENSSAELFRGASMILTPFVNADQAVIDGLVKYFAAIGFGETVITTPEKHDAMIAFTSQLCHVIATTYASDAKVAETRGFTAGSYANMTRIATQDASVWRQLYSENRDELVGVLDDFMKRFKTLRDAIQQDDASTVERLITQGAEAKRRELARR